MTKNNSTPETTEAPAIKSLTWWRKKIFSKETIVLLAKLGVLSVAGSLAMTFVYIRQYGGTDEAMEFINSHQAIVGYTTLIMTLITFFLWGLIGSTTWTIGIYSILLIVIMFINEEKMRSRNIPFTVEDLAMSTEAGSLMDMVDRHALKLALLSIVGIIVLCTVIKIFAKYIPQHKPQRRYKWGARLAMVLISGNLLAINTHFLRTEASKIGNGVIVDIDWLASRIDFTNLYHNFKDNGYIVGTITTLQSEFTTMPDDYSQKRIDEIVQKYSKLAAEKNQAKKNISDEKINIIYVMSESFIDPYDTKSVYNFSGDPMPYTRQIMAKHSSGRTTVSEFGGGTANVEFEALTGFTNKFLTAVPYTNIINRNTNTPSIAKVLNSTGYTSTAIHPYKFGMYNRNAVYPNLGFSDFIHDQGRMSIRDKEDSMPYLSDESAFKETIKTITESEGADFIHLVTMQNHMPYDSAYFKSINFQVSNELTPNDEFVNKWSGFFEGINRSDIALKNFLKDLDETGEKTMVVFWGDHWPGDGISNTVKDVDDEIVQHTPLFIYTNFESKKQDLGNMSLNLLQSKVFDQIDAKKSPFQYLLTELSKSNPELTSKKETPDTEVLREYELIQYDILAGKKWSLGDFYEVK